MRVAAAHKSAVDQHLSALRRVLRRGPERMWLRRGIVDVVAAHERAELVVVELAFGQPRALLEHNDRMSRRREFLRDDAAGGSGADDDEVHDVAGPEARARARLRSHQFLRLTSAS
jgi:hypothetical protein